ncbi:MAG: heme ABC exporter ATP-binding protein CcmA, partial [Chloroflexota bacterium]
MSQSVTHSAPSAERTDRTAVVDVEQLRVILGEQTVLRGVTFAAMAGSVTALVGPNGAGKSTLLRVVAGLLRPSGGRVLIGGRSLAHDPWRVRRAVGLVGHQPMVYPELTTAENLEFYARLYGLNDVAVHVEAGLRRVDLQDRASDRAGTLSRGMLQRLSLARALLHEPDVLLLDEAEAGLDAHARDLLLAILRQNSQRRTTLLATHDLAFVSEVAERAILLRNG